MIILWSQTASEEKDMTCQSILPKQADIRKAIKAAFDAGSEHARIVVGGFVIEASKQTFQSADISPLDGWRKQNGQG
jgi:hypothetical protein